MAVKAFRIGQAVIYLPTGQRGYITAFREDSDRVRAHVEYDCCLYKLDVWATFDEIERE